MSGYRVRAKWLPPPTIDDYMWEIMQSVWCGEKERAKRQLVWIMDKYLGDDSDKEAKTTLREVISGEVEAGEDGGRYRDNYM